MKIIFLILSFFLLFGCAKVPEGIIIESEHGGEIMQHRAFSEGLQFRKLKSKSDVYNLAKETCKKYNKVMGKLEVKINYDRKNISETAKKEVGLYETNKWTFDCVTFEQKAILDAEKKRLSDEKIERDIKAEEERRRKREEALEKKLKLEKNTNIVAEYLMKNNDISNEAFYEEKRRREKLERELAELKAQNKKEKQRIDADIVPPQITIISSDIKNKQGIIEGLVLDNIKVAELTINGEEVNFDAEGNFNYSTFIPKIGKEISIQATDTKGLYSEKILTLKRKKISTDKKLNFSELNPLKLKGKENENALALIIGVNNYLYAPEAIYADRDASYFSDFANNAIGIKKENIKTLSNAKAINTEIKIALKSWLKGFSTPNKSDIYIFFAGHGLTNTNGKELYLLPHDGEPRLLEDTALLRSEIFDTVKSINPKSVTVFLDACYSGQTREKDMIIADARPIAIVPIESDVPENFVVFSASSGSEISGSLPEADHGLFSYFLMKGLEGDADANNDRKITNGELHSYVRSNVTRQAIRLGREQTPQLQGDENRVLVEFN